MSKLSESAQQICESRYFMEGENEDWEKCTYRVADTVSSVETDRLVYREKFHNIMNAMEFLPGGRILRNCGRARGSLFNCYVVGVGDSMEEILDAQRDAGLLWSDGGGVGFNFSPLRPNGDPVRGPGGETKGPLSFLLSYDALAHTIQIGGGRRAAALASLDITHPDIVEFLDAKLEDGKFPHFNFSVNVTNEFLEAVEADAEIELKFNQRVYSKIKARTLWDRIIKNMVSSAEPGLLNTSNLYRNNSYYFDQIIATNPCVTGDTKVQTTMGNIPIKNLTKYKQVEVYTRNKKGDLVIKPARFFRTKTKARVITVNTSRGSIKCTPDHKFITPDGEIEAQNLQPNQNLYGLLKKKRNETHLMVGISGGNYVHESNFVASYYYGDIPHNYDVHHVNGNSHDNTIFNLQVIPHYMHSILTNKDHENWGNQNEKGQFTKKQSTKSKANKKLENHPGPLQWKVLSVDTTILHEPVFDGQVEDTHCYFANGVLVHNCGEIPLGDRSCCLLGSIVLPKFLTATGKTNWKHMEDTIYLAVRFLDNVLEVNKYRLPAVEINAKNSRRIGLGYMGIAEYMFAKKVRYGSKESIEEADKLAKNVRNFVYTALVKLAVEKGAFPKFNPIHYGKADFIRSLPASLRKDIKTHGTRCVTGLAVAPNGTIALIPEVTGGIEPLFAKAYKRKDRVGERMYIAPHYQEHLESGNEDIPEWLVDSYDLKPEDHLEMQSTVQKYIDSSVSKTINLPKTTTDKQLSALLLEYLYDLKGVTVYRDGSKKGQVLNVAKHEDVLKYIKSGKETTTSLKEEQAVKCKSGQCEL